MQRKQNTGKEKISENEKFIKLIEKFESHEFRIIKAQSEFSYQKIILRKNNINFTVLISISSVEVKAKSPIYYTLIIFAILYPSYTFFGKIFDSYGIPLFLASFFYGFLSFFIAPKVFNFIESDKIKVQTIKINEILSEMNLNPKKNNEYFTHIMSYPVISSDAAVHKQMLIESGIEVYMKKIDDVISPSQSTNIFVRKKDKNRALNLINNYKTEINKLNETEVSEPEKPISTDKNLFG